MSCLKVESRLSNVIYGTSLLRWYHLHVSAVWYPQKRRKSLLISSSESCPRKQWRNQRVAMALGLESLTFLRALITLHPLLISSDLVNQDSWFILQLLQIDHNFLTEDVESWPDSAAYQESAANVEALNVINDCTERGVKLSTDFLAAARSEEHYQNILQVVEQDRQQTPNLRKRKCHQESDS